MTSVYDPTFSTAYDHEHVYTQVDTISTLAINAYAEANNANNLTLGGSSNVQIEAREGVQVFISSNNSLDIYNTQVVGGVRTNTKILTTEQHNGETYVTASNLKLSLVGLDSSNTTTVGKMTVMNSNNYQLVSTSNSLGFLSIMLCLRLSYQSVREGIHNQHRHLGVEHFLFLPVYLEFSDSFRVMPELTFHRCFLNSYNSWLHS